MPLTLLLCDDHRLFREGLAALLCQEPGWQVVGHAADGDEAIRRATELKPAIAVMDVGMPGKSGIEATAIIRRRSPETRVVALSMFGDPHYRQRMVNAGASAYVLKSEAGVDLIAAIRAVQRGEGFTRSTLSPASCASLSAPVSWQRIEAANA